MTKIGLPVPQGFTVTTEACTQYYEDGRRINVLGEGRLINLAAAEGHDRRIQLGHIHARRRCRCAPRGP